MARKRMVTRTIKGENLTVLCVRTGTRETFETSVVITEKFPSEAKKMSHIAALFEETAIDVKPVAILNSEPIVTRYGMTEEMFIKHAKEIPMNNTAESEDDYNV